MARPNSYHPLAQRFRPKDFASVVGQDVPLTIIKNSLRKQHLPHAILLHGIHGTGKTTLARIIAKAVNCLNAPSLDTPCNACESCQCIEGDTHPDVREVDAASRTGVDDIRELLDSLPYQPVLSSQKVYIIDEIHMLSKSAFNALLKNLEEPPEHVKFIFATTELYKVPATTLSRCLILDLSPIPPDILKQHLASIAEKESVRVDDSALDIIARHTGGSARNAVMALEKVILFAGDEKITDAVVQKTIGVISSAMARTMLEHLLQGEVDKARALSTTLHHQGVAPMSILHATQGSLYNYICDFMSSPQQHEHTSLPFLLFVWQVLIRASEEVSQAQNMYQALEVALLRFHDLNLLHSATQAYPSSPLPTHGEQAVSIANAIKGAFPDAEIKVEYPHKEE